MRNSLIKLRRSLMTVGLSAAMLLTGAGSALAATDGQTSIGTGIASGGNFDLSDAAAGDTITIGDAGDTITIAGFSDTATIAAGYQPLDTDLTNIAALATTPYGRGMLVLADAAAGRTALGLGTAAQNNTGDFATAAQGALAASALQAADIGVSVQGYASNLALLAGAVAMGPNSVFVTDGAGAALITTMSAAGRAILDDADAAAQRTTLGLGTMATQAASSVAITGGTIDGTAIGNTTRANGAFSGLSTLGIFDIGTVTVTDDIFKLTVNPGGAARFNGTLTMVDLTGNQTWMLPDASGTIALVGHTHAGYAASGANSDITSLSAVTAIDTIQVSATDLLFAGAATIRSQTSNPLTLDSSGTGDVNLGVSDHAKTINIGTGGTAAKAINIGTGGNDTFALSSTGLNVSTAGAVTGASGNISMWTNNAGYATLTGSETLTNKTLTNPTIDNIRAAGVTVLAIHAAGGEVNYIEAGAAAAGGPVGLMTKGGSTNIGLTVGLKGTGVLTLANYDQANYDTLVFAPALGGGAGFSGTLTSADLTANRSWSFPDASGTVELTGHTHAGYAASGANSDITSLGAVASIDSGAALNIGGSSATSIAIGKAGLGVGLPGGAYLGGHLHLLVQSLAAFAGGGQASATAITGDVAKVTSVASPGDSVRLPVASPGMRIQVINRGANSLNLYPATGENINALLVNNPYALPSLDSALCVAVGASDWECSHLIR